MPPFPSGYETDTVFRLTTVSGARRCEWVLTQERLPRPFRKLYDRGNPDQWLQTYADESSEATLRFLCAYQDDRPTGLVMWQHVTWNNTIWLMDMRVREESRRAGIGTALIRELKAIAAQKSARGISVETQITNFPAIQFYCKQGFQVAGFNDHLYTNRDLEDQEVALFLFWASTESAP